MLNIVNKFYKMYVIIPESSSINRLNSPFIFLYTSLRLHVESDLIKWDLLPPAKPYKKSTSSARSGSRQDESPSYNCK